MNSLDKELIRYKHQHQSIGCKVCHLIGVPLIAISLPLFFFSPRKASKLFAAGCALQLSGHYLFEHNQPVFFKDPKNLFNYLSALVFAIQEWKYVIKHHKLSARENVNEPDVELNNPW